MKQKAIICDIDGVLLDTKQIFEHIETAQLNGAEKWNYFNRHANDDEIVADEKIIKLLELFADKDFRIIFLSARMNEIESQTRAKIDASIGQHSNKIFIYMLLTRPQGNKAKSAEVKQMWVNLLKSKYDIYCAIDDEPDNCEMYAKNGILTMHVIKK